MPIKIYTYTNPYKINEEVYWNEITNCPYFCVAQTLVNGLKVVYPDQYRGSRVQTIKSFTDQLFAQWESDLKKVRQLNCIEYIISSNSDIFNQEESSNFKRAFLANPTDLLKSVRILFELDIETNNLDLHSLDDEIQYLIKLYEIIKRSPYDKEFQIDDEFTNEEINKCILNSMANEENALEYDYTTLSFDTIVIHGVHQFSPLILKTIEIISEFKTVILLFNYQSNYPNLYQTWINVYSKFTKKIEIEKKDYLLNSNFAGYSSNLLGDGLAQLLEGKRSSLLKGQRYEIGEFLIESDFSQYIAERFNDAVKINSANPMLEMKEYFYAADNSVNRMLEGYFPEYYKKDNLLEYPLGQFFYSILRMWNPEEEKLVFLDLDDLEVCLSSGVLISLSAEKITTIFSNNRVLFDGCSTIEELIKRIKRVKKLKKKNREAIYLKQIVYYETELNDLEGLLNALEELNMISHNLLDDFENTDNNLNIFYTKVQQYLNSFLNNNQNILNNTQFIIEKMIEKLTVVNREQIKVSFNCLVNTMPMIFSLEFLNLNNQWIVRNFEQIEGDVLRSSKNEETIYHFSALADQNMTIEEKELFPWPLSKEFFDQNHEKLNNRKLQIYIASKNEYSKLKRFALIYGLLFNKANFKLSFVKKANTHEYDPYYLLLLAGVSVKECSINQTRNQSITPLQAISLEINQKVLTKFDYYRYGICKYRFLLDSLIQEGTVFTDSFLLQKYCEVLLENRIRERMIGQPVNVVVLTPIIIDEFNSLQKFFPFITTGQRMDIINRTKKRFKNAKFKIFPNLTQKDREWMRLKEIFIYVKLEKNVNGTEKDVFKDKFPVVTQTEIEQELSSDKLNSIELKKSKEIWCQYCSNYGICAEFYTEKES